VNESRWDRFVANIEHRLTWHPGEPDKYESGMILDLYPDTLHGHRYILVGHCNDAGGFCGCCPEIEYLNDCKGARIHRWAQLMDFLEATNAPQEYDYWLPGPVIYTITCGKCGTVAQKRGLDFDCTKRWFRDLGWRHIGRGDRCLCPRCSRKERAEEER